MFLDYNFSLLLQICISYVLSHIFQKLRNPQTCDNVSENVLQVETDR